MAFLYSTYIVMYAIASPLLGRYIDHVSKANNQDISSGIRNIAGVQFTILAVVIISATFIPRGAGSLNPEMIGKQDLECPGDGPVELSGVGEEKRPARQ